MVVEVVVEVAGVVMKIKISSRKRLSTQKTEVHPFWKSVAYHSTHLQSR